MPSFRLRHDSPCRDGGILNAGDPYSETVFDLGGRRVTNADGTAFLPTRKPIGCYVYRDMTRLLKRFRARIIPTGALSLEVQ